jgi:uncharacterized SAM-binding protein YcdF (DUF218 family)
MMKRIRFWFRSILLLLVAIAVYFAGTSLLIQYTWKTSKGAESDVIIILGAAEWNGRPSPALRERLDVAIQLWNRHIAPHIIASGGIGLGELSEAEVMKRYLVRHGVPDNAIETEAHSKNTLQNLQNSQAIMQKNNWSDAVIVTHGFHVLRASLMAKSLGLHATLEPVQIVPANLTYYTLRECAGIAYFALQYAGTILSHSLR